MENYPPLPTDFRPELLRRLTLKEMLVIVAQFGLLQVAERIGYDEFVQIIKKVNADVPRPA
jgi:hypothetical protein